jgi:SMC interacting uncharacterized protein involved in chromosome segregation
MGTLTEHGCKEKLDKAREKLNSRMKDIRSEFAKLEKTKTDLLRKTEEARYAIEHEMDNLDKEVAKSKDLAPESKRRLDTEIELLKGEIQQKYLDLKTRIAETIIPA